MKPADTYNQRISEYQEELGKIHGKLRFIPWLRLLFFLCMVIFIYYFVKTRDAVFIIGAGFTLAGFILSGLYDFSLKNKINNLNSRIKINKQEVEALHGNYSFFDPGIEFINEDHPYVNDLDIFGKGSLFQCVNRTSTVFGKKRLAEYFCQAYEFREEMLLRQQAIRELSGQLDFRQELQRIFLENQTTEKDLVILMDWLAGEQTAAKDTALRKTIDWKKIMKGLSFAGPGITFSGILLSLTGIVSFQVPVLLAVLQLLVVFAFGRRTQLVHQNITAHFKILQKYSLALSLLEKAVFDAVLTKRLQRELKYGEKELPSRVIRRFSQLLNWMDSNMNLLVSVILNGLFMFNIHLLLAVDAWRHKYKKVVPKWFEILAEFEALSGLAAFSFNNPEYVFPEAASGEFLLIAEKTGHPLIPRDSCVRNDIEIRGWKQFNIITGANMSGKSTFLRTIGTNCILAMMGAPVFADKFIFTPVEIHSSIRTSDSLVKGESYFYSELKRLKEIIAELESGRMKLILLDEILKGTNSADKQSGSIALIKQLMKYKVVGMFATHDVAIGGLTDIYPGQVRNLCFEIFIENDKMEIDYKLHPGVCRNLNASYLMKKMGILPG